MDKHVKEFLGKMFELKMKNKYLFRKLYGLTFVFRRDIVYLNDYMSSGEILPVGIIYEENGEYYFARLDSKDDIEGIVEEFVKTI